MVDFIVERPELRVVTASLGYNWYQLTPAIDPTTHAAAKAQATAEGLTFAHFMDTRRATRPVPLVVVAACNDSDRSTGTMIDARWGSPFTAASLIHGEDDIIVVESVGRVGAGVSAANTSNAGGHVAAPGAPLVIDAIDEIFEDAWSFSSSGELSPGVNRLCFALEAIAEARQPQPFDPYPSLVEGTVTMTFSLDQP